MPNNEQEEIIIIQDGDVEIIDETISQAKEQSQSSDKGLRIKLLSASLLAIAMLVIGGVFLFKKLQDKPEPKPTTFIDDTPKATKPSIKPSNVEKMIAKANYLYSKGSKDEALVIYKDIATYSEAISAYNLGVAQLKEKSFESARANFQRAIDNNENRCVSAINAAVCSLELEDKKSFEYYIDLAEAFLPDESKSSLYSYYYTLISFYKGDYLQALSAINSPTTDEYHHEQNLISSKIDSLFYNNKKAIEALERDNPALNGFTLGMLYARIGELELARRYLANSIKDNKEAEKSQVAIGYIDLKLGNIVDASKEIENALDLFGEDVFDNYPIKVSLKKALFDVSSAQNSYRKDISQSQYMTFSKLFYFSPYKIFDANKVLQQINKGSMSIDTQNIDEAKEYLKKGISSSTTNKVMVKAIQLALKFRIREANKILEELAKSYPKHSILQYNLALTYAQMGNMVDANRHFIRSYNLDAKNYLSGIYAIMTSALIQKDSTKLSSIVSDSLMQEEDSDEVAMYKTLFHIAQDDYLAASDYIQKDDQDDPLKIALDVLVALRLNVLGVAEAKSQKLIELLPKEIIPHTMYIDSHFLELRDKEYAFSVLNYLKNQDFDFRDLYNGPFITRFLYVQLNLITGRLYYLKEQLKEMLLEKNHTIELVATLALASLYDNSFEESFSLYNKLIDEDGVKDTQTLFLASVASIAAGHNDNAIALLELSKLREPSFLESRYALGLLHLEKKNYRGAVSQLQKVEQKGFNSFYFDFDIDTSRLLFLKQDRENQLK
ncbi:MAG: hypothetical protein WC144_03640 [Sulfurimonas sp.]|jgi:Tfp pilus assembly protein PilF|nr:hypothetical protein [Sulfurimonadaceae bacterium]